MAKNRIWYHTNTTPQIIGNHNNGCFIGDYEGLHKCLQTANNLKRPWKSVVVSQDCDGDYHLFQTDKHWIKYPSRHEFMASYEIMKT